VKKFIAFFLLFTTLHSSAQNDNYRPMRDSFTLVMPVTKGTFYQSHIPSSPFIVGPKILQIFPGETVFIEVEQADGIISDMKSVKENKQPEKTLEITFVQNTENNAISGMMLKVKNPFKKDLSYKAMIRFVKGNWAETSIIPVKAGIWGYEMWPDVIVSIALNEWKFL
jgi:hypothetical protein